MRISISASACVVRACVCVCAFSWSDYFVLCFASAQAVARNVAGDTVAFANRR